MPANKSAATTVIQGGRCTKLASRPDSKRSKGKREALIGGGFAVALPRPWTCSRLRRQSHFSSYPEVNTVQMPLLIFYNSNSRSKHLDGVGRRTCGWSDFFFYLSASATRRATRTCQEAVSSRKPPLPRLPKWLFFPGMGPPLCRLAAAHLSLTVPLLAGTRQEQSTFPFIQLWLEFPFRPPAGARLAVSRAAAVPFASTRVQTHFCCSPVP